ncbi:helix-turn-helix domain-containing protein [Albidovulum sediminis]|uniref:Helix-turn-helix domain-containing protein n=1 Tax=Albidovulum sediminis TaxID=3066345 RepID=A0ABT2NJ60_9RHOB|nr:helix-turn-helix domain-containing protein [Defluviimonas sediminis]MCT8328959.1 helix-turn-helix domain-containing protein [Defluviimonas sediminis]
MLPRSMTRAWIEERLDVIHPAHVAGFVTLMTELRRHFDGDLEALLVLACISARVKGEGWQASLLHGEQQQTRNTPTNALSISHCTGIPRESVRRRIRALEEKGWIERDSDGNWGPTLVAAKDLRPATEATIIYLKTILGAAVEAQRNRPD